MIDHPVILDGETLSLQAITEVARAGRRVALSDQARERVRSSADQLARLAQESAPIYGVNTGFGHFADYRIESDQAAEVSRNLILSHAVAVGPPFPEDVVRAAMLIRANTLAKGYSAVQERVLDALINMLNAGITPIIPSQGSLGSSGDLAPLAHLALCFAELPDLEPEPLVWYQGEKVTSRQALRKAGIPLVPLAAKDGLALTNGATFCAALLCLACLDARRALHVAQVAAALSFEALRGNRSSLDPRLHDARPHPGQARVAEALLQLTDGSQLLDSGSHVQDAYSLRCAPQIIGPAWDILAFAEHVAHREINSATDNPLIFGADVINGGNFHGEPLGLAADYLKLALSEVCAVSERRAFRLLSPHTNRGLPPMLVPDPSHAGLQSGLMMLQYTAASLTLEIQKLAAPDSIRSLPTSADQEDQNANATNAARSLKKLIGIMFRVISVELMLAAQALEIRMAEDQACKPGRLSLAALHALRKVVPFRESDAPLGAAIESLANGLQSGDLELAPVRPFDNRPAVRQSDEGRSPQ